jgi:hypothetical protein
MQIALKSNVFGSAVIYTGIVKVLLAYGVVIAGAFPIIPDGKLPAAHETTIQLVI